MAKSQKLTTNDVARAVGVTPKTITRYADRGIINAEIVRLGPNIIRLFDPAEIPKARAAFLKNTERYQTRAS